MKLIATRLTPTEAIALDQLADLHYGHNRSKAIAAALQLLFAHHQLKPAARRQIGQEQSQTPRRYKYARLIETT